MVTRAVRVIRVTVVVRIIRVVRIIKEELLEVFWSYLGYKGVLVALKPPLTTAGSVCVTATRLASAAEWRA